jgi:hypothetical protein
MTLGSGGSLAALGAVDAQQPDLSSIAAVEGVAIHHPCDEALRGRGDSARRAGTEHAGAECGHGQGEPREHTDRHDLRNLGRPFDDAS